MFKFIGAHEVYSALLIKGVAGVMVAPSDSWLANKSPYIIYGSPQEQCCCRPLMCGNEKFQLFQPTQRF